jgi:hypothetical protein
MKMKIIVGVMLSFASSVAVAQEFKVVTVVESIVPGGIGRSRMIEEKQDINHKDSDHGAHRWWKERSGRY